MRTLSDPVVQTESTRALDTTVLCAAGTPLLTTKNVSSITVRKTPGALAPGAL